MASTRNEARRGLRGGAFALAVMVGLLALSSNDAEARRRRHATPSYTPPYAAFVVDANSAAVLHSANADELRHPASLTKIMTLYLLFEQLAGGKLKLDSSLHVSEHAASQSPTKLGLKAGSVIDVESAIKGMVTRSANDAAVVVGENLGGSEDQFAKMMTRKAHALGMTKTVYRNASGLPDDGQVTTARDQSILGRAIQERFPLYYRYFQTRSFSFQGHVIGNHNRLLGTVEGVDGIKTGYTQSSGYNLVTSVHRNGRYLVAVVLGGTSAGSRDARMRELIEANIKHASINHTASLIAQAPPQPAAMRATIAKAESKDPQRFELANAKSVPVRRDPSATAAGPALPRATPGSSDPIRPVLVKTVTIKSRSAVQTASALPLPFTGFPRPSEPASPAALSAPASTIEAAAPAGAVRTASAALAESMQEPLAAAKPSHSGWIIQVGAYSDETEAKQRLVAVKGKASRLLASAEAFTESVLKDGTAYYRARFAGLNKEQAEAACKYLKHNDIDCLTIKN